MRRTDFQRRVVVALLWGCGALLGSARLMPAAAQRGGLSPRGAGLPQFGSGTPKAQGTIAQDTTAEQAANEAFQVAWDVFRRAQWAKFDRDVEPIKELESGRAQWSAVARAIAQGATDLSATVGDGADTVLHVAARFNDLTTAKILVSRGFKVDGPNSSLTPLHRAAETDAVEVAAFLLEHGANPNIRIGERQYQPSTNALDTDALVERSAFKGLIGRQSDACMGGMYQPTETGFTPLHIAAMNGANRVGALLLKHRAVTNLYSSFGRTPLHVALSQKNDALVTLLLAYGAKPDALVREQYWARVGSSWGTLPLTLASHAGSLVEVTRLLDAGADVNGTDEEGASALHQAIGQSDIVELLLARGARVDAKTLQGETPLSWWAANRYGSEEKERRVGLLLLSHGANVNTRDNRGATPLHLAVATGKESFVRILLDHGAKINARNTLGQTPLHLAALNNDDKIFALLIARGADQRARTRNAVATFGSFGFSSGFGSSLSQEDVSQTKKPESETAEMILQRVKAEVAARRAREEALLKEWKEREKAEKKPAENDAASAKDDSKANPPVSTSSLDIGGFSPAEVEIANRHLREAWQKLRGTRYRRTLEGDRDNWPPVARAIAEGANDFTLTVGEEKDSPLHVAAFFDDLVTVQTLVQRGLSSDLRNLYQFTPLHRAAEGNAVRVAAFLLSRGASVNAQNSIPPHYPSEGPPITRESAWTPLHLAARSNAAQVARLLLAHSANVKAETTAKATPLLIAARNNSDAVARLLLLVLPPASPQERKAALGVAATSNAERVLPLLTSGVDLNAPSEEGKSLLFAAASFGRDKSVAFLLAHGARPDADGKISTPLHAAVDARYGGLGSFYQHDDGPSYATDSEINHTINELLDHGAHIDAQDEAGTTPLCRVVQRGKWGDDQSNLSILALLLARGANVQLATEGGNTPLHWAVKNDGNKAVVLLLSHKARANAPNELGWTPLHQAIWRSKSAAVASLLKSGANPLAKDKGGVTPLALALKIDASQDIVAQLQRAVERR